jgi:hypothetical protein
MFNQINKNIVLILGINKLPVEKQKDAMESLGGIVYQEVMFRVIDILSDEDKNEFEKLTEKNPSPEIIFGFLANKVPNLGDIAKEETLKLNEETKDIMSKIGK